MKGVLFVIIFFLCVENTTATPLKYTGLVKKYSKRYGFDYRLILAVIQQESGGNPKAISHAGAEGLMQLMPYTSRGYGVRNAFCPRENIATGVLHLRKMYNIYWRREEKERIQFALASYNCGPGHVIDGQKVNEYFGEKTDVWDAVANKGIRYLGKENTALHKNIFGKPEPKHGYFQNWKEPVHYVSNILKYYAVYRQRLSI